MIHSVQDNFFKSLIAGTVLVMLRMLQPVLAQGCVLSVGAFTILKMVNSSVSARHPIR
ncbi:MAG: hypothetical protein ACI934_002259 [Pseudohongiellaceae bacterium]|jgi:hypothetical protein